MLARIKRKMKNHKTVMCKVVIVLLFCISMIIVGVQGVTANTLSVAEEKQAADTVAKGGYQVIMTRTPIFGLGIADKYRTPMIMDALLDLVKHPERVEDDEDLIAWRELFRFHAAWPSRPPGVRPRLKSFRGHEGAAESAFVATPRKALPSPVPWASPLAGYWLASMRSKSSR